MAAPKENQFWKLRNKHGRDKLFEKPTLLMQAACDYFQWCDDHPWYKTEQVKSPGRPVKNAKGKYIFPPNTVKLETARPYTLSGLCIFLGVGQTYFNDFKKSLKEKKEAADATATAAWEDFSEVITRIEEIIRTQKFEGAAVGAFNANIIARDLGLVDKTDLTTKGDKLPAATSNIDLSNVPLEILLELAKHTSDTAQNG